MPLHRKRTKVSWKHEGDDCCLAGRMWQESLVLCVLCLQGRSESTRLVRCSGAVLSSASLDQSGFQSARELDDVSEVHAALVVRGPRSSKTKAASEIEGSPSSTTAL